MSCQDVCGSASPPSLRNQKTAFKQFYDLLRPGGILIIDHRNYDYILKHGKAHNKNIYYNSSVYKVVTQTIYEEDKAKQIVLNYRKAGADADVDEFTLSVQPYKLAEFSNLLRVSIRALVGSILVFLVRCHFS